MRKIFLLLFLVFFACKHSPDKQNKLPNTDHSLVSLEKDQQDLVEDSDNLIYEVDTTNLTPEPNTPVKLLMEGAFHKNEVWKGAENKNWFGLHYQDCKYYLKKTSLQIVPTFDPVLDAKHSKTGKKIISGREVIGDTPNTLFFITGLERLQEGPVDSVSFSKNIIPINKSVSYSFNNRDYKITAYGDSTKLPSNEYVYQNYGWKVKGIKKGKVIEQILAEDTFFEDSIYMLLWAGDLDKDGIPDLLIDISNHYNTSKIALYLSSTAKKGKLYQKVAVFETVGA
jgi:hypothetical protein